MVVSSEEIQKIPEEEQLLYIDCFLNNIDPNASSFNIRKKLKMLRKYILNMKNDIYIAEFFMGQTDDKNQIIEYQKRIDSDHMLINEINEYIKTLSKRRKKTFSILKSK